MEATVPRDKLGFILKLGVFVLIVVAGLAIFSPILYATIGYLPAAALGTFAAAAVANSFAIRIFERARLADIGLQWDAGASRNLLIGLAAGIGAACLVLVPPLLTGAAELQRDPEHPGNFGAVLFVCTALLFGAIGEEMLFRGYAFQLLWGAAGRFATILPGAVLFGLAHTYNQNVSLVGIVNTFGFGIVLGYALVRSGDLWLPIGVHYGWNVALPLFGVNLSGFTMNVTGYAMRWSVSDLWSGGSYGPEGSIVTSVVIVLLIVYLSKAPVTTRQPFLVDRAVSE